MKQIIPDARLYCQYSRLVKLQAQAQGFSLLPNLKAGSVLSGRHGSVFRGRGLNFEELRHYQLGDDIRNLDWKVTLRTGKPHVRAYSEEKDRNFIICIDQRSGMFFSSVDTMKSVVAAELAALTAWRILNDNDRVGFVIQTPQKQHWLTPKRGRGDLLHRLQLIATANQQLNAGARDSEAVSCSQFVGLLGRLKLKNATLVIFSDWQGVTTPALNQLQQLQKHNDVLGVLISDPFETNLPVLTAPLVLGDGEVQINVTNAEKLATANQHLAQQQELKRQNLLRLMTMQGLPMLEMDTSGEHIAQFKRAIGARQ